ncbi:MAG: DUF2752 domain-containing protein [Bacteroidota bacterium]|nr:DUF2752 domain-containing protein [Bacteroidota bacterium]
MIVLAVVDAGSSHLTICPFSNAGFEFCPGCGLGRSVSHAIHGDFRESIQVHPLGIFAVIVLSFRIANLTKLYIRNYGKSY